MSSPAAKISVWAENRCACVRIEGRANFTSSIDFNSLVTQLREQGFTNFTIELSDCSLMDSTFLGVLAGIGLKLPQNECDPACPCLELRNANARIAELLENIGVLHLFKISEGAWVAPATPELCAQPAAPVSRADLTRTCLEAHELLMTIKAENVARFKDVTKFLAEDLARLKGNPS